eukprot:gene27900-34469_t
MEALKADMAVAEAERLECMAEVQLVSKELHDLQKKLGLRRRLDYVKLWKKVKLAIQFQYVMGKPLVVDGSEPAVEDDLASSISGYTTHALANLMISKTEDLLEAREILQTRLEQVQEIRGEWEEVGLEASDPNGPAAEDDLSWTRLNHLEHIIKERRARVKELCQSAYKQLGELWKKKPPTLDVQQKMYNLAGVGTMDALTHLEEAARTSLQREVKETHKSLSDMLAKLGLSETDRALRLHPASWTVAELLAGQQQLRQLRAMQKACYEAGAGGGKERLQLQLCIEELEVQVSPVLLVVLWGGVEANGTKPAVPGDIYIPPQAKQLFYGDEGVIPEREHVDDLSVSLIASPERADSGTAIGPASSIRKNMLRSKSRARRTSSYNSGLMGQVRLVVADKVVATQRTMLAVIDLAHISSGVTL